MNGVPQATYRFQLRAEFGFDAAATIVPYLSSLGISHAYLSPILQAAPGSTHGYDVVDHSRLSEPMGGRPAFDRLSARLTEHRMGAIADVVPNHVAVPTPARLNKALWSVLRDGPGSPYAEWFDVDWGSGNQPLLMAVLGNRIGQVLAAGELSVDGDVLRYYDHEFPLRPGTAELPIAELVTEQWYRLAHWRVADEELNYRRFFDVDTLAAVRVETQEVFEATHALLFELLQEGKLNGFRIDHPDGLADPRGYLRRLAERTRGAWVVVEKILEGAEELPHDWPCAGTTGYDALLRVGGLFIDPAGAAPLAALHSELTGEPAAFHPVVLEAKREIVRHGQYAEVHRLVELLARICQDDVRLRDHTRRAFHEVVVELLVQFEIYRAYVVPGEQPDPTAVRALERAASKAREHLDDDRQETLDVVLHLLLGRETGTASRIDEHARHELIVRFQQTCGPVMAKGVEDTAFYRWFRLSSLNEVGGDPEHFGVTPEEFHAFAANLNRHWPRTMTTLSTHDTKRSEDVRARLGVLSEQPAVWADAVREWRRLSEDHRSPLLDGSTEYLFWQTLYGTWGDGPIAEERMQAYLLKAIREAKRHTTWTESDEEYEQAVAQFTTAVLADETVLDAVRRFANRQSDFVRAATLGQKLVQLTMPGVPDVYQGTELVDLSLVDPDNRRAVDYEDRIARLHRLDEGAKPDDLSDEKLLVTARALRLRRQYPEAFAGSYTPLPTSNGHAVAFARGDAVITIATRLPAALYRLGGWGDSTVVLPSGEWKNVLTGRVVGSGAARIHELLEDLPVALLVRS
ncbi:malto-oligosyltrehalose synthase [Kribbella sandramycini]|uniref:(1->4)-alpha-D-glucan 1-alpha-D-glucosylmutase n=1 Tax=Kribbella sandramycini TaxID=60450 RepID=A0A7Y4L2E4_9ACTN|nr:malto-oligosyltrehalose synthase [Kribbella sandramycini]MBB6566230.1 (1->4)-alpha-D-glucan 1-alpha-D-glucosylmutase [Kribbella sandramycini]NOL43104.1 malto-oligosyltrehalose synthase [Kribbella sandramycini]